MPYGDFNAKLDALMPMFARTRFIHGRIGNAGAMQVPIGLGGRDEPHRSHFIEMWRRCLSGFLTHSEAHDQIVFAPELLPPTTVGPSGPIYLEYAQLHLSGSGHYEEVSDRWQQALILTQLAKTTFVDVADNRSEAKASDGKRA